MSATDRPHPPAPTAPVVHTVALGKQFGEVRAVRTVDLTVPRNSIFGFLGPNGAGKSTTLRVLVGLLRPTSGHGHVLGHDISRRSLELRRQVGYLPQQPRYYPDLTARETLRFAGGFFFRPGPALEGRIETQLELVELAGRADRPVGAFSGGERQRLGLAQAQLHEPELLILDEPAAGLDPLGRRDVLELLQRLRDRTTVLYSTHILDDVQRVSDMVGILANGTMVAQAPIGQLLAGPDGVVYHLTVRGHTDGLAADLRRQPWVTNLEVSTEGDRSSWEVAVNDEQAADRQLLRLVLAEPALTVLDYGRRRIALEDAFVRLVQQEQL